ncbi:MAG: lipid-A-disaccharide synthase [Rhodospirillales bacterium]
MSPAAVHDGERSLVYLVAGEPSGDVLGARLVAALKRRAGDRLAFAGLGGERMAGEGIASLFPIAELSHIGLDAIPHIPHLLRRMREVGDDALARGAQVVVTIDVPDFSAGVWRRLRGRGIPLVHYVAPTVWAWRAGRARRIARRIDHLLALFPFEPPYFEREGLPCTFVGHPAVEGGAPRGDGAAFRARHGIARGPVVALMPGSRHGEVGRHLGPFGDAVRTLAGRHGGLTLVLPTVQPVAAAVRAAAAGWGVPHHVVEAEAERYDAVAAADAALVASGTATLEVALAGVPMIVTYRTHPLTHWVGRRLVRVPYLSLVNILLGRAAVPELLQDECRGDALALALAGLLENPGAREAQRAAMREAAALVRPDSELPSDRAAAVVLDMLARYSAAGGRKAS